MASFSATGGVLSIDWSITGLSVSFISSNYIRVGISTSPAISDSLSAPSGILGSTSSGAGGYDVYSTSAVAVGSYTVYGWAQANNSRYYPAGVGIPLIVTAAPSSSGVVRICLGGATWVNATPYICLGGTTWVVATPYICTGGATWVPTT